MTVPTRPPSPIENLRALGAKLHDRLEAEVHSQRLAGASWEAIAQQLGVAKQNAHKRWRYLDDIPVQIRRVDGQGVVTSPRTGACVGHAQQLQVEAAGVITEHHPRLLDA